MELLTAKIFLASIIVIFGIVAAFAIKNIIEYYGDKDSNHEASKH